MLLRTHMLYNALQHYTIVQYYVVPYNTMSCIVIYIPAMPMPKPKAHGLCRSARSGDPAGWLDRCKARRGRASCERNSCSMGFWDMFRTVSSESGLNLLVLLGFRAESVA